MKVNKKGRNYVEPVISGLVLIFGIGLLNFQGGIVDGLFREIFTIQPNNYLYKEWKDPSVDIRIDFYFFNWTNPEDLMNTSVKPKFQEIGPIVFHEEVHKWNVTFHDNNTVSYRNFKSFYYDKDESRASMDDNITSLNAVPLIASEKSRNWNFLFRKGLSIALYDVPHHLTKKAKEWLFDGYEDSLLSTANYLPIVEDMPDMDKFAWFYKRNASASYEGDYNIGTGMGNTTMGQTYKWNFRKRSDYHGQCGEIEAPTELYPRNIQKDKIELFFPDFCRKIILDYNETLVWRGLEVYKFTAGVNFLDNGKYHPENTCLCNRKCLKFGVLDYSKCKFGIPGYLSLPHFNTADPKYLNDVEGMKPNDDIHRIQVLINPGTGTIIDLKLSVQLNMLLEPNPSISKYRDVPELMMPIFWFLVDIRIDTKNLMLLYIMLHLNLILKIVSCIIIVLGLAIQIRFFLRFQGGSRKRNCVNKKRNFENSNLITNKNCCDKS